MHSSNVLTPVAFSLTNLAEIWRIAYLHSNMFDGPSHHRNPSGKSAIDRPSFEFGPQTPMRGTQRSFTTPASSNPASSSGGPSMPHSRNVSSTFPPLVPLTSYDNSNASLTAVTENESLVGRGRQSSLPTAPKPKRRSSGLSTFFKRKSEPKIKLVGEAPRDQVPIEWRVPPPEVEQSTLHLISVNQTLERYGTEQVNDLTLPPPLKLAPQQQLGRFQYAPGTLFQAGSGARLPTSPGATTPVHMIDSRRSSGMPTTEQIQQAFEKVVIASSNTERVPARTVETPTDLHPSRRSNTLRDPSQERPLQQPPRSVEASFNMANLGVVPSSYGSSNPSWETVEPRERWGMPSSYQGGEYEDRRSGEERYDLPASNSKRNSKRMSQVMDVIEEDDGKMMRRFGYY